MKQLSPSRVYIAIQCLCVLSPVFSQTAVSKEGCFSSSTGLTSLGPWTYQSSGYCQTQCVKQGKAVGATSKGSDCWCGDKLPPQDSKTDDSDCDTKCQGFPEENCGGSGAWTVFLTGSNSNPGYASGSSSNSNKNSNSNSNSNSNDDDSSSSATQDSAKDSQTTAAPTKKSAASVVTRQSTVVVTAAGGHTQIQTTVTTATAEAKGKSGPNTAGIAAGVVVGVVALGAIAGGIFFFLRQRKRKAEEEEYQKSGAMGSYSNLKPSTSSAGSMSDSRLEPSVMMQRRQSDGSIADNQDYSRRILKVNLDLSWDFTFN